MNLSLFIVVLGGRSLKGNIEIHDVRWVVGESIEDTFPQLCLLYTSPSPRDRTRSRMPSSA